MSSWRNLRSISSDPLSNFMNKLVQDMILKDAQENTPETIDIKTIGVIVHSILDIRDLPIFAKTRPVGRNFFLPVEPDRKRMRLWVKFNSAGDTQIDYSLWENEVLNHGYIFPTSITSDTYDEGLVGGQLAMTYNSQWSNPNSTDTLNQYTSITDNVNIRMKSYNDGTITGYDAFCISMLIRPMQIFSEMQGTSPFRRKLYYKIDDATASYGYAADIDDQGNLNIIFRENGTDVKTRIAGFVSIATQAFDYNPLDYNAADYNVSGLTGQAGPQVPTTNTSNIWYRVDIIYIFATNTIIVRKDGVTQGQSANPNASEWPVTPSTHTKDLLINTGRFDTTLNDHTGFGITEYADFRIYVGQLTQAESTNLQTNKYTIGNIPLGQVAVYGYWTFS
jgi:hypothetical protein